MARKTKIIFKKTAKHYVNKNKAKKVLERLIAKRDKLLEEVDKIQNLIDEQSIIGYEIYHAGDGYPTYKEEYTETYLFKDYGGKAKTIKYLKDMYKFEDAEPIYKDGGVDENDRTIGD